MVIKCLYFKMVLLVSLNMLTAAHEECETITCKLMSLFEAVTKPTEFKPFPIGEHITKLGYPFETHEVQTEDGYLLTLHRIPYGKERPPPATLGPPVLLQHGFFSASLVWVIEKSRLGFLLADAGYDVWLANGRGNIYSRGHVKFDFNKDKQYYDYSWHEKGYYDLPAFIDYILKNTSRSQLTYIGHSIGPTTFLVLGATRPEYMEKVKVAFMLGPVAYPRHFDTPLAFMLKQLIPYGKILSEIEGDYLFPSSKRNIISKVCQEEEFESICKELMLFLEGTNNKEDEKNLIQSDIYFVSSGVTFKELEHLRQITGKHSPFAQFNYGKRKNIEKYHSIKPPIYKLANVKAPVVIYYAKNDWFACPEDVDHLIRRLPNINALVQLSDEDFKHRHFLWGIKAKSLIYDDLIDKLNALQS